MCILLSLPMKLSKVGRRQQGWAGPRWTTEQRGLQLVFIPIVGKRLCCRGQLLLVARLVGGSKADGATAGDSSQETGAVMRGKVLECETLRQKCWLPEQDSNLRPMLRPDSFAGWNLNCLSHIHSRIFGRRYRSARPESQRRRWRTSWKRRWGFRGSRKSRRIASRNASAGDACGVWTSCDSAWPRSAAARNESTPRRAATKIKSSSPQPASLPANEYGIGPLVQRRGRLRRQTEVPPTSCFGKEY